MGKRRGPDLPPVFLTGTPAVIVGRDGATGRDFQDICADRDAAARATDQKRGQHMADFARRNAPPIGGAAYLLAVGKPYGTPRRWPEGPQFTYRAGGYELLISLDTPTPQEAAGIDHGPVEFALRAHPGVIVVYTLFAAPGATDGWIDATYSWWRIDPAERTIPDPARDDRHALVQIVLLDARDGTIRALRALTVSPEFTRALHAAIRAQAADPQRGAGHNAAVTAYHAAEPDVNRAAAAAPIRCRGGA